MTAGIDKSKMSHAVWAMLVRGKETDKGRITSRTFEIARRDAAEAASLILTGIKRSEKTKQNMRKPKSVEHTKFLIKQCIELATARRGKPAHNKGQTGINSPLFNKPKSEKHKQNMRKPKEKATCIHCGLIGSAGHLKRYHFNKCKSKKLLVTEYLN